MIIDNFLFLKQVARLLVALILCQSCTLYTYKTVTLDQAINSTYNVEIILLDNRKLTFDSLTFKEDVLYGINTIKGEEIRAIIPVDQIKVINLIDKAKSNAVSLVMIFGGLTVVFFVVGLISIKNNGLL
jgi:hypothetical protein